MRKMKARRVKLWRLTLAVMGSLWPRWTPAATPCPFDGARLEYVGTPSQQASCLMRHVGPGGALDAAGALPSVLATRVGKAVAIAPATLRRYLQTQGIAPRELGGEPDAPLSRADNNAPTAPVQRYFVIHDASYPIYGREPFPADIDLPGWRYNDLSVWDEGDKARAHLFINRRGESFSPVGFAVPWRATKFEMQYGSEALKGLFLHIELIQPRREDPAGPPGNDRIAPQPGFTEAQYRRLALAYVAASVRRGEWLIPAFHAVLDAGKDNAHDDPQNFSVAAWAQQLEALVRALGP